MSAEDWIARPNPDCPEGGYLLSPAGVLLVVADTVYLTPHECGPGGLDKAKKTLDELMASATARGFRKADVFLTLVAQDRQKERVKNLALEATRYIGDDYKAALARAGWNVEDEE